MKVVFQLLWKIAEVNILMQHCCKNYGNFFHLTVSCRKGQNIKFEAKNSNLLTNNV